MSKIKTPHPSITEVLSKNGFIYRTELDRMGVPKSLKPKGRYNKSKWLFTRMEVHVAMQKGY